MSIFDTDIVTSEVHIPLKERFAYDLSSMICKNRKSLISALKTHGVRSVMNCIEMYVNTIRLKEPYSSIITVEGRDSRSYYNYYFVTLIKGELWVVLHCRPIEWSGHFYDENYGDIIIVLDQFLRETKFKVK